MPNNWAVQRVYSGVDAVRAADVVRSQADRREQWPYLHIYAPPNAEPVHQIGTIATPAAAATAVVLTYTVPSGYRFFLRSLIQVYEGGNFVPGDALWTVDRNTLAGSSSVQSQPEQGLVAIPVQLGSLKPFSADKFWRAYEFEELDIVRSKARNVNLGVGAPNYFVSGFFGYLVPMTGQR